MNGLSVSVGTRVAGFRAGVAALGIALLALVGGVSPTLERAEASTRFPSHAMGPWFYDSYGLGVYPPRHMRPTRVVNCYNGQQVWWSPGYPGGTRALVEVRRKRTLVRGAHQQLGLLLLPGVLRLLVEYEVIPDAEIPALSAGCLAATTQSENMYWGSLGRARAARWSERYPTSTKFSARESGPSLPTRRRSRERRRCRSGSGTPVGRRSSAVAWAASRLRSWPVTALMKCSRSSARRTVSIRAAVAVRGTSRSRAISPKDSPGSGSSGARPPR